MSAPEHFTLLTAREAAALLRVTPKTLENWRSKGYGPRFLRIGRRRVAYDRDDLHTWLEERRMHSDVRAPEGGDTR